MELVPTTISAGYAAGLNAYGTVFLLGLLGRAGFGEVPHDLTTTPILIAAGVMFAIEFITDKVPFLDSTWDLLHTAIRPAIGSLIGVSFADLDHVTGAETVAVGGASGTTALVAHSLKAGIRLGINTSPEPASNVIMSLLEDGVMAVVVALALKEPFIALAVVIVLLAIGIALVIFLRKRIKLALERRRARRQARSPSTS
jgi:Domain of unknown function (DUF4126)